MQQKITETGCRFIVRRAGPIGYFCRRALVGRGPYCEIHQPALLIPPRARQIGEVLAPKAQ